MTDLIKRADAIKAVEEWAVNLGNPKMLVREDALLVLKDIPSAENKGEWRTSKAYPHIVFCDECGEPFERSNTEHFNFCPNCGCRMKGADDD